MLTEKIFKWEDRLYKSVFKGNPHVFTAQDFNRYLDVLREYQIKSQNENGGIAVNFTIELDDAEFNIVPNGANTLQDEFHYFKYRIISEVSNNPCGVLYDGIMYQIPTNNIWQTKRITAKNILPNLEYINTQTPEPIRILEGYFYLVATIKTVAFSDTNPIMHVLEPKKFSGVSGSSLPTDLPSADNTVLGNERLVYVDINDLTSTLAQKLNLTTDEKVVGIIATLKQDYLKNEFNQEELVEKFFDSNGNLVKENSILTTSGKVAKISLTKYLQVFYNILHPKNSLELSGMRFFKKPDFDNKKPPYALSIYKFLTNNSLYEKLSNFYEEYLKGQTVQDYNIYKLFNAFFNLKSSYDVFEINSNSNFQEIFNYIRSRSVGNTNWIEVEPNQFTNGAAYVSTQAERRVDYINNLGTLSFISTKPSLRFKRVNKETCVILGTFFPPTSVIGNQYTYVSIFKLPNGFKPIHEVCGSLETYSVSRQNSRFVITTDGEVVVSNIPVGITDPIYIYSMFLA